MLEKISSNRICNLLLHPQLGQKEISSRIVKVALSILIAIPTLGLLHLAAFFYERYKSSVRVIPKQDALPQQPPSIEPNQSQVTLQSSSSNNVISNNPDTPNSSNISVVPQQPPSIEPNQPQVTLQSNSSNNVVTNNPDTPNSSNISVVPQQPPSIEPNQPQVTLQSNSSNNVVTNNPDTPNSSSISIAPIIPRLANPILNTTSNNNSGLSSSSSLVPASSTSTSPQSWLIHKNIYTVADLQQEFEKRRNDASIPKLVYRSRLKTLQMFNPPSQRKVQEEIDLRLALLNECVKNGDLNKDVAFMEGLLRDFFDQNKEMKDEMRDNGNTSKLKDILLSLASKYSDANIQFPKTFLDLSNFVISTITCYIYNKMEQYRSITKHELNLLCRIETGFNMYVLPVVDGTPMRLEDLLDKIVSNSCKIIFSIATQQKHKLAEEMLRTVQGSEKYDELVIRCDRREVEEYAQLYFDTLPDELIRQTLTEFEVNVKIVFGKLIEKLKYCLDNITKLHLTAPLLHLLLSNFHKPLIHNWVKLWCETLSAHDFEKLYDTYVHHQIIHSLAPERRDAEMRNTIAFDTSPFFNFNTFVFHCLKNSGVTLNRRMVDAYLPVIKSHPNLFLDLIVTLLKTPAPINQHRAIREYAIELVKARKMENYFIKEFFSDCNSKDPQYWQYSKRILISLAPSLLSLQQCLKEIEKIDKESSESSTSGTVNALKQDLVHYYPAATEALKLLVLLQNPTFTQVQFDTQIRINLPTANEPLLEPVFWFCKTLIEQMSGVHAAWLVDWCYRNNATLLVRVNELIINRAIEANNRQETRSYFHPIFVKIPAISSKMQVTSELDISSKSRPLSNSCNELSIQSSNLREESTIRILATVPLAGNLRTVNVAFVRNAFAPLWRHYQELSPEERREKNWNELSPQKGNSKWNHAIISSIPYHNPSVHEVGKIFLEKFLHTLYCKTDNDVTDSDVSEMINWNPSLFTNIPIAPYMTKEVNEHHDLLLSVMLKPCLHRVFPLNFLNSVKVVQNIVIEYFFDWSKLYKAYAFSALRFPSKLQAVNNPAVGSEEQSSPVEVSLNEIEPVAGPEFAREYCLQLVPESERE